jgi:Iron-containing redox enzyme
MPLVAVPTTQARPRHVPSFDSLHRELARLNRSRLAPCRSVAEWSSGLDADADADDWETAVATELRLRRLEHGFVEAERCELSARTRDVPSGVDDFVAWFEQLQQTGPGQGDWLFAWLAEHAPYSAMCWFLRQELAGEAGFDDLLALTQLRLPVTAKLEMARNYWDEMGQGNPSGMHGPMLERLGQALDLNPTVEDTVWESLALANLMVALAANRCYAYQSVGALGVIELTAPGRAEQVNRGLKRLGVGGEIRRYYALHATLDVKHSQAWNREVLRSLVARDRSIAPLIAEGALLRLRAGERCFERYRRELGLS